MKQLEYALSNRINNHRNINDFFCFKSSSSWLATDKLAKYFLRYRVINRDQSSACEYDVLVKQKKVIRSAIYLSTEIGTDEIILRRIKYEEIST